MEKPGATIPHFAQIRDDLIQAKAQGKSLAEFEEICAQDTYQGKKTRLELFGWETVRRHARQRWQMDPRTLDPVVDGTLLAGYNPETVLPAISCPTYLLGRFGQGEYVSQIEALIPNSTSQIVSTDDHRIHETSPDEYIRLVKEFMTKSI